MLLLMLLLLILLLHVSDHYYKQGQFESFNLLGIVTSLHGMTELSRHGSCSSIQSGYVHVTNPSMVTGTGTGMTGAVGDSPRRSSINQISNHVHANTPSSSSSLATGTAQTTSTATTAASPSSFGGLVKSYVNPNFLSNINNISGSITKEIESLNSTIYSYSQNHLGQYPSLASTVGAATGVGAMGRDFYPHSILRMS